MKIWRATQFFSSRREEGAAECASRALGLSADTRQLELDNKALIRLKRTALLDSLQMDEIQNPCLIDVVG